MVSNQFGAKKAKGTNILKEDLENTPGLLVDETRDTLDTATTSEAANGGLGDALDVIAKNLAVALGSALAETLKKEREGEQAVE